MPLLRNSRASASSVSLFPRPRMRDITSDRLVWVKTSGMATECCRAGKGLNKHLCGAAACAKHPGEEPEAPAMNEPLPPAADTGPDNLIFNEVQLVLSEKRTSLSAMRTGIAIFAFPLSVLSVLIATSRYYETTAVLHWLVPLLLLNGGLVALGTYLIVTAMRRIRHYNQLIDEFKRRYTRLAQLLD